ncbi:hypothetical protein WN943_008324 [Citrus x changshan-huyou]
MIWPYLAEQFRTGLEHSTTTKFQWLLPVRLSSLEEPLEKVARGVRRSVDIGQATFTTGSRKRMTVYFLRMFKIFDGIIDERFQVKESLMNSEGRTDTTSRTVEWAVAEFLHNPKVLTTAQYELRELLGNHDGEVDRV